MKVKILFITILIVTISCQQKQTNSTIKNKDTIISMNQITTDYDTLINRVKYNGNIDAYDELFYSFMDSNESERTDSLMIYAKIMAEKYNYKKAYLDYFKALCGKNNIYIDYPHYNRINLSKLPINSKKETEDWLNKMLDKKIITKEQFDSIQR
ncbi:MAG: hypothetical protein K0R36_3831 [Chryseobacterium sp.]|jgi:outer membrane protein assembly factor BamD (BamD/ComL family)|nr:hypothetical protein [Chryseobacterium sp.]